MSSSNLSTRDLLLLSQASTRSPPRQTSNHMSGPQCEQLVELCRQYYEVISDTGNSIESRTQRRRIWEFIAQTLNEKGKTSFTAAQYKKKYQNLKTSLKAKMNAMKKTNPVGQNNNNISIAKKMSDASSSSPASTSSAFGSPLGFNTLQNQLAFPSFFNPPSQLASATSSLLQSPAQQTVPTFSAALAAAAGTGTPAAGTSSGSQQIFAPIPQMGLPLNLQSLMSSVIANEQAAAAAAAAARSPVPICPLSTAEAILSPPAMAQSHKTEGSEEDSVMSSPGAELHETLNLANADPADVFCISLAESIGRIRVANPLLYTQLKRDISVLVLETEIKLLEKEQEDAIAAPTIPPSIVPDAPSVAPV